RHVRLMAAASGAYSQPERVVAGGITPESVDAVFGNVLGLLQPDAPAGQRNSAGMGRGIPAASRSPRRSGCLRRALSTCRRRLWATAHEGRAAWRTVPSAERRLVSGPSVDRSGIGDCA